MLMMMRMMMRISDDDDDDDDGCTYPADELNRSCARCLANHLPWRWMSFRSDFKAPKTP